MFSAMDKSGEEKLNVGDTDQWRVTVNQKTIHPETMLSTTGCSRASEVARALSVIDSPPQTVNFRTRPLSRIEGAALSVAQSARGRCQGFHARK